MCNDREQMSEDIQGSTQRTSSGIDAILFEAVCDSSDLSTASGDRCKQCEDYYSELKKRLEARGHEVEVWNSATYDLSTDKGRQNVVNKSPYLVRAACSFYDYYYYYKSCVW